MLGAEESAEIQNVIVVATFAEYTIYSKNAANTSKQ